MSTHWGWISVAAQRCMVFAPVLRLTCHGHEFCAAFTPPMIRGVSTEGRVRTPHVSATRRTSQARVRRKHVAASHANLTVTNDRHRVMPATYRYVALPFVCLPFARPDFPTGPPNNTSTNKCNAHAPLP